MIIRPDLLLALKSVAIALTNVVESSDIIFIEFAMYLRSPSTLRTPLLSLLPHQPPQFHSHNSRTQTSSALSHYAFHAQNPTRIKTPTLFHHHLNNLSCWTIARTERSDRLLQMAQDSWHNELSILWECEVWMNVESPLGRAKWIFWAEMLDTMS